MTKTAARKRLKEIKNEIDSAASARDALSRNGVWMAVNNCNDVMQRLAKERDEIKKQFGL